MERSSSPCEGIGQARHRPTDGHLSEEQKRDPDRAHEGADPRGQERRGARHPHPTQEDALLKHTPLWFYILREAELNNGRLKGVGARIVAETFHRAMEGSEFSIVRDPTFTPTLGPDASTFRMVDLLLFAFDNDATLLNPLGN